MRIDAIKATDIELTDGIRAAVERELTDFAPLTERYGAACSVHVEVGRVTRHHQKGDVFRAEFNLKVPGRLLRAEEENEDLYVAVNRAGNELRRQLKDDKGRHIDVREAGAPDA